MRRGARIFAHARAAKTAINERGIVARPDLVIVADDTLVGMAAAGVTPGIDAHRWLLINSRDDTSIWPRRVRHRRNPAARRRLPGPRRPR